MVRAYSDSVAGAIDSCIKVKQTSGYNIECFIEYNQFEKFQYYCKLNSIQICNVEYLDSIICKISIEESLKDKFIQDIIEKNINIIDYKIFDKTIITINEIN